MFWSYDRRPRDGRSGVAAQARANTTKVNPYKFLVSFILLYERVDL